MPTHRQIETFNQFIARQSGAYFQSPDPVETEKNRQAAVELTTRVQRHTRYAYGLGRNQRIVKGILETLHERMKDARLEAYQTAYAALLAEKLEADELKTRTDALRAEHNAEALVAEYNRRHAEIMDTEVMGDDGVTPLKLYRILVTDLPGWHDSPNAAEGERRGIINPMDIAFLMDIGVLHDPADDVPVPAPGPAN